MLLTVYMFLGKTGRQRLNALGEYNFPFSILKRTLVLSKDANARLGKHVFFFLFRFICSCFKTQLCTIAETLHG